MVRQSKINKPIKARRKLSNVRRAKKATKRLSQRNDRREEEKNKEKKTQKGKVLMVLLLGLFLINFASAFEFDNILEYDEVTREAHFYDCDLWIITCLNRGDEIGKARLNTPLNVIVPRGYQKVAEFDLWAYEDYNNALKQFTFSDMKDGKKKINRDYDLKYLSYEDVEIDDYVSVNIGNSPNGTIFYESQKSGSHTEQIETWTKITPADLKKNDFITIGVFTEVQPGDYIDWIPHVYGMEVPQWAAWTENLKVGLLFHWTLNETTGSIAYAFENNKNLSILGPLSLGVPGKINGSFLFPGSSGSDYLNGTLDSIPVANQDRTLCSWVYPTEADNRYVFGYGESGANFDLAYLTGTSEFLIIASGYSINTSSSFSINDWYYVCVTFDGTYLAIFVDGSEEANLTTAGINTASTGAFTIGTSWNNASTSPWKGNIDEFSVWDRALSPSEMINLTNGGDGLNIAENEITDNQPIITLLSPSNNINYTTSPIQVNLSCYASDDVNLTSVGLYLNGSLDQLNASGINNTNYTFSKILTDGSYNWSCEGTDNASQTTLAPGRKFGIHSITPNVTISYPTGDIDYILNGSQLIFSWEIQEQGQNLTTHIKNCTYEYNGVITEINNTVCTQVNETTFTPVPGIYNLTFLVTDEFDFVNTTVAIWDIKLFEVSQSYNNETTEGSLETFLATVVLGSGYSITDAVLFSYNNSVSIGQSFINGSDTILRKADLLIPTVTANTNITFYWNVTLSDETNINLSSNNQTIYNLDIDNCSTYTTELFNFTVVDEETQAILPNATIETAINIFDKDRIELVLNYSNIFLNINPLRICINRNISAGSFYSIDSITRYEDSEHANEYYNTVNQTLTNGTVSQIITLYDLNLNDSQEFQLTFTGADFLPVENALVYVDRQYINENQFKTVELPKTDYNGQTVLHLVRNDVIYNIRITKDGVILGNFENLVAFCDDFTIGDCNIELNAFDSVEAIFDYNEDLGIIFDEPEYNETQNIVSFNFVTSDGTAKEVILEVTRNDIFGNRSVCNSTLISSGGTLTCSIDPNLDESTLNTNIYVDDILTVKTSVDLDSTGYGAGGALVAFAMIFTIILLFSESREGILISLGVALASTIGLGLQSGNMTGVGASGIWLLIIIIAGIYKLKKGIQQ